MNRDDNNSTETGGAYSSTKDKIPLVLSSTNSCKWRISYYSSVGDASIEFPVGAGSILLKLKLSLALDNEKNRQDRLKLGYDYIAKGDCDDSTPKLYIVSVSVVYGGHSKNFPGPALPSTKGCCYFPLEWKDRWITLELNMNFHCNLRARSFPTDHWNERHQSTCVMHFLDMLESGDQSDVKIISSDGQELKAHKLILRARNEVFDAMFRFRHDMEESKTGVIKLDDMSAKAVKFLLHYIYSSQMLKISPEEDDKNAEDATIGEVLYLAFKFGLKELITHLDENILEFCNKENAWHLFKLCKLYSLEKGNQVVFEFMHKENPSFIYEIMFSNA